MLDDDSMSINKLARVVKVFMYTSPYFSCSTANSWIGVAVVSSTSLNISDGISDTEDTLRSQASSINARVLSKEEIV